MSLRHQLEYTLARGLFQTLRTSNRQRANAISGAAARLLDRTLPKLRRYALINLSFAYPDWTDAQRNQVVDGVFQSIARILVAMARMPDLNSGNIHDWIGYDGLEHYREAKRKRKGILVATAHFGNWELSAFAHALMTEPMNVMVRPLDNPLVDSLVENRRTLSGNHLIQKKDAARSVLKALRNNEAVGILCDQNTALAEGLFIDFFGKSACASSAFVKLAHHSSAAVLPGYAVWEASEHRYRLVFEQEVPMTGDLQTDTQSIHTRLEAAIRQHPDQWLWIHRRWKTRPPGDFTVY